MGMTDELSHEEALAKLEDTIWVLHKCESYDTRDVDTGYYCRQVLKRNGIVDDPKWYPKFYVAVEGHTVTLALRKPPTTHPSKMAIPETAPTHTSKLTYTSPLKSQVVTSEKIIPGEVQPGVDRAGVMSIMISEMVDLDNIMNPNDLLREIFRDVAYTQLHIGPRWVYAQNDYITNTVGTVDYQCTMPDITIPDTVIPAVVRIVRRPKKRNIKQIRKRSSWVN